MQAHRLRCEQLSATLTKAISRAQLSFALAFTTRLCQSSPHDPPTHPDNSENQLREHHRPALTCIDLKTAMQQDAGAMLELSDGPTRLRLASYETVS